jgi:tetratricopeptide (TPR) repeat protein
MPATPSHPARAAFGILLLGLATGSSLATGAWAQTAPHREYSHESGGENPYVQRRNALRMHSATSPALEEAPAFVPVKTIASARPAGEPMRIDIPNLQGAKAQLASLSPARAVALDTGERPRQTVAEFKPIALASLQANPLMLGALAPAAGEAAPLIAAPQDVPPPPAPPIAAIAENPAPAPASPPAAPTQAAEPLIAPPPITATVEAPVPSAAPSVAPIAAVEEKPADSPAMSSEPAAVVLDRMLSSNETTRSSNASELPPLETKPKKVKTPKRKTNADSAPVAAAQKPYSPLDSEPAQGLSPQSEAIAERMPSRLNDATEKPVRPFAIDRTKDLDAVFAEDEVEVQPAKTVEHEAMGVKIRVSSAPVDLNYELEKAYNALMSGQPTLAIEIYKNVLSNDPANSDALFGIATTYHRTGQLDNARIYYGKLLALKPRHRDGLNNFLVLLADEAPEQALQKMQELAERNPSFSPIPAQMAVIYQRMGDADRAVENMFKAIALAPENMVYRYNLAVMLDKQKKYDEAARLYRQLLEAASRGETIPGNVQKIQQRLTFISSNGR